MYRKSFKHHNRDFHFPTSSSKPWSSTGKLITGDSKTKARGACSKEDQNYACSIFLVLKCSASLSSVQTHVKIDCVKTNTLGVPKLLALGNFNIHIKTMWILYIWIFSAIRRIRILRGVLSSLEWKFKGSFCEGYRNISFIFARCSRSWLLNMQILNNQQLTKITAHFLKR